jgi:hypothetical protein
MKNQVIIFYDSIVNTHTQARQTLCLWNHWSQLWSILNFISLWWSLGLPSPPQKEAKLYSRGINYESKIVYCDILACVKIFAKKYLHKILSLHWGLHCYLVIQILKGGQSSAFFINIMHYCVWWRCMCLWPCCCYSKHSTLIILDADKMGTGIITLVVGEVLH